MVVKLLLPLVGAPDLDSLFDEPLHNEGRFILAAAKTVEHEDEQDAKFSLFGIGFDGLQLIAALS